jgi:hypothetical protein
MKATTMLPITPTVTPGIKNPNRDSPMKAPMILRTMSPMSP